jgi:hypothetical protein
METAELTAGTRVIAAAVLIGYFPKRRTIVPEQLRMSGAEEICSVSECLARGPEGWVEAWLHNSFGCFNSPEDALQVAGDAAGEFQILAYRLLPLRFRSGGTEPLEFSPPAVLPLPLEFRSLGFDIVSKSVSDGFECSPLSCNSMALELAVNRHCLVDHLDAAIATATRFSVEEPEPGPCYVVEVLRGPPRQGA